MINNQQKMFNGINKKGKGFTLLELLIVIAILAILSVVTVLVLNPAETLRKARDVQRISDLDIMKTALGLYLTTISSPALSGADNTKCKNDAGGADTIFIDRTTEVLKTAPTGWVWATSSTPTVVGTTGWLPVNFNAIAGGSPISNLPRDPAANVLTSADDTTTGNRYYTYSCLSPDLNFELNANLESSAFTSGADNKENSDGGDATGIFEKGTSLTIMSTAVSQGNY